MDHEQQEWKLLVSSAGYLFHGGNTVQYLEGRVFPPINTTVVGLARIGLFFFNFAPIASAEHEGVTHIPHFCAVEGNYHAVPASRSLQVA